ncbi:hypothetical protein QOT17_010698 [Balamuthia mandrillaris]
MAAVKPLLACILVNLLAAVLAAQQNLTTCNSGYGFAGECASTTALTSVIPDFDQAKVFFESAILTITQQWFNPSVCVGDFWGSELTPFDSDLYNGGCWHLPLPTSTKTGVVSFFGKPACAAGSDANVCFTFDNCGSVAISLNKAMLKCIASTGSGMSALLSDAVAVVNNVAFGMSRERRYVYTFNVALPKDNIAEVKEVTVQGHYFDSLRVSLPNFWGAGSNTINKIIDISGEATRIFDFSDSQPFVDALTSLGSPEEASSLLDEMKGATETHFNVKGIITLKLDDLTKNFLKAFIFTVDGANLLISNGGGTSGVEAGVYAYLNTNVAESLQDAVEKTIFHFNGLLKELGVPVPKIVAGSDAGLGVFVTGSAAGFSIRGFGLNCYCTFKFPAFNGDKAKASCNFANSFFTAIWDGVKWVIKEATEFFLDTGRDIARISADVGDFTEDAVAKGVSTVNKLACKVSNALFGSKCKKKSGAGDGAKPGDGTIYRFIGDKSGLCLSASSNCATTNDPSSCKLTWSTCQADSWLQMWQFTADLKLCNVFIENSEYGSVDVDDNRYCISSDQVAWDESHLHFDTLAKTNPWRIRKIDTYKFKIFTCTSSGSCDSSKSRASPRVKIYQRRDDGSWVKQNGDTQFKN